MPMSQAIDLLQSPDAAPPDCLRSVLQAPDRYDRDLVLIAAAIYSRPDYLPLDILSRLTGLLANPSLSPRTLGLAREVLQFLLATPFTPGLLTEVMALASQPGLSAEVYADLCQVLEYAAAWACPLIDLAALVTMAEAGHLQSYRDRLCALVIEPAVHATGESVDVDLLRRIHHLYGKNPGLPYLLYTISQWRQFPAETRDWEQS